VHASRCANPAPLPPGAVVVVGCGGSDCQIAEELYQSGRIVYLSVGRHRRIPRRYRGRDLLWWLHAMGRFDVTVESLPDGKLPPASMLTCVDGGHTIELRRLVAEAVTLLGSLRA
jgi:putative flavoprotein involved in K+ transport